MEKEGGRWKNRWIDGRRGRRVDEEGEGWRKKEESGGRGKEI